MTVRVVLTYSKGEDSETCEVSFVATLSRKVAMNSTGNVVVDGKSFALSEYISVSVNGSANSASYYDDTLVLTLPASGTATLEVKLNKETPVTKTYNNEKRNYINGNDAIK